MPTVSLNSLVFLYESLALEGNLERFESNLFEMIHVQQDIVNGLLLQNVDGKGKIICSEKGRDVFQFAYEDMPQIIEVGDVKRPLTLKNALSQYDHRSCASSSAQRY